MIDARGFSCPEPVIMIKKAMASKEDRYDMMVDNKVSVENVTRFAEYNGYEVACEADGEDYKLSITKK
ncbi:MAG: sulfurtransferase TusA family protein [Christensenellaceae bacterium]|nr:sulfurtransferase TusA family protein [Christensenellaceae bacterium]